MVASRAKMESSPGAMALELAESMELLASKGEWNRVEQIAVRLRTVVLDVPGHERREVVQYVNRCLERVQTQVLGSRNDVTDKLSEIRRGRDATKAYGYSTPVEWSQGHPAPTR